MPLTAQQFINAALLEIDVIAAGDTPNATESGLALIKLNEMMESWSLEPALCLPIHISVTPTAGTSDYSMGPGGTFNTIAVLGLIGWRSKFGNFEISGRALSFPEFESAVKDGAGMSSQLIQALGADHGGIVNGNLTSIRLWPTPAASPGTLVIDAWTALPTYPDLTTLPANAVGLGYELAIRLNLAIALAPSYGRPVDGVLGANAQRALDWIRALHLPSVSFPGTQAPQAA